ncbi:MAG TPA: Wzz/FepE/Etk N-terminal domain-containing protein [Pilimelia sp.]|nr:Wzz/FepE/Etk N-terminal domain-containing protein [Pilimelia sp.]
MSDYLGMFRRHWWLALLLTLLGVGAAEAVTRATPRVYEASTSVLVQPVGQDTNVVGGRTKGDINLDTEAQLVGSGEVAAGAAKLLRTAAPPDALARNVTVEVPANTAVLVVRYAAGTPADARAGSHAFAEAYLRNREASARADLNTQASVLSNKIKELNATLLSVNRRLARTDRDSPDRPNLETQRRTATNQLDSLTGKLNQLTTATASVSGGKIISDARLPDTPTKPQRSLNLATGAMVGLLLGLAVAGLRERFDHRVRRAADVERRTGVPVLAELTARTAPRFDDVLPPYGAGGRVFNRLRNEVLAGLAPDAQVLVVTGASPGPAATLVAANLATALSRTGSEVVLVGAHLPESLIETTPLARIFGVQPTPGLSDALAGRVSLADAAQRAPRNPYLRVITTGGVASAGGLIQSQALRETLDRLRQQCAYVVIEAPSTATSADAQSLASLADGAIVVVELRRTHRPQVADAAEQIRRVTTPLLGAVVLPRLTTQRSRAVPVLPALGRPGLTPRRVDTAGGDVPGGGGATTDVPGGGGATTDVPGGGGAATDVPGGGAAPGRLTGPRPRPSVGLPDRDGAADVGFDDVRFGADPAATAPLPRIGGLGPRRDARADDAAMGGDPGALTPQAPQAPEPQVPQAHARGQGSAGPGSAAPGSAGPETAGPETAGPLGGSVHLWSTDPDQTAVLRRLPPADGRAHTPDGAAGAPGGAGEPGGITDGGGAGVGPDGAEGWAPVPDGVAR